LHFESNKQTGLNSSLKVYLQEKVSYKDIIADVEKKIIEEALRMNDRNQSKTAVYLNMNRRLLYSKIIEHNIIIK
jgi:DNA-binding NtrC family response regulator